MALAALVIVTVLTLAFILTRLGGDLAISIAGPNATQADVDVIRQAYGLDRPLVVQFIEWVGRAAVGDFGESFFFRTKVSDLILERLPTTLTLGLVGLTIALCVAIPLGTLAAVFENRPADRLIMMIALVGQAMPSFWLSLLMMVLFGLYLNWLPISGTGSWEHYVMPGIVLAFSAIPAIMRLTRAGVIDSLGSDYIRTARSKGISKPAIVIRHALRNAAMPVVAISAVQLGFMLGGSVVIETVFALHGVGYLAWESISKNDFPTVQAVVLLLAVIFTLLTLVADLLNALLDPRLRKQ